MLVSNPDPFSHSHLYWWERWLGLLPSPASTDGCRGIGLDSRLTLCKVQSVCTNVCKVPSEQAGGHCGRISAHTSWIVHMVCKYIRTFV